MIRATQFIQNLYLTVLLYSLYTRRYFVVDKLVDRNEIIVARGRDHPALFCDELQVPLHEFNWFQGQAPHELLQHNINDSDQAVVEMECLYKVRYRQELNLGYIRVEGDQLVLRFENPQRAVTIGQTVVLYNGEECLGGGIIGSRGSSYFEMDKHLPEIIAH